MSQHKHLWGKSPYCRAYMYCFKCKLEIFIDKKRAFGTYSVPFPSYSLFNSFINVTYNYCDISNGEYKFQNILK